MGNAPPRPFRLGVLLSSIVVLLVLELFLAGLWWRSYRPGFYVRLDTPDASYLASGHVRSLNGAIEWRWPQRGTVPAPSAWGVRYWQLTLVPLLTLAILLGRCRSHLRRRQEL
jgi:hypothetical protein